jgi:hypothetical protein
VFVTRIACVAELVFTGCSPKLSEVGDTRTPPAFEPSTAALVIACAEVPFPLRLTFCGLPASESLIAIVADSEAATLGGKVILIVQLPLVARPAPQLFVWPKSAAFDPLRVMGLMVTAIIPVFVSVTASAALVR